MKNKSRILIVDEQPATRESLKKDLQADGYWIAEATSKKSGLRIFQKVRPDLILLDWDMRDKEGEGFLTEVRLQSQTPIIALTVHNRDQEKIFALDQGADDCITKPFSIEELKARIRAAIRHSHQTGKDDIFVNGPLRVEYPVRRVFIDDLEVKLTATEYDILKLFCSRAGVVLTQVELLTEIWGIDQIENKHSLRVYISQLRKKLEKDPRRPALLLTELGVGFRMPLLSGTGGKHS